MRAKGSFIVLEVIDRQGEKALYGVTVSRSGDQVEAQLTLRAGL